MDAGPDAVRRRRGSVRDALYRAISDPSERDPAQAHYLHRDPQLASNAIRKLEM
jgi:hypothetical protein